MESNLQQNFNVGFTNMKSDVLIHLTQWQYWWWFWFSLLWAFYYMMILKMVRFRSLKFRPRLATTLRPHGKWGDLIVCIIPVSWCANIITNSNFILRMIEWQSESGLLTVRIRGKQWYWVYKFELKTFTDIFTIPKNIGHNKWQISTPGDIQVADDYLHVMQLRSQNKWAKSYWEELSKEVNKSKNFHMISPALSIISKNKESRSFVIRSIDGVDYFFQKPTLNIRLRGYLNYTGLFEISIKDLTKEIDGVYETQEVSLSDKNLNNTAINEPELIVTGVVENTEDPKKIISPESVENINLNIVDETLFEDIQLDPVSGNPIIEGFISIPGEIISNENKIVSDEFNVIDENIGKLETNSSEAILNLSQNNINLDTPVDNINLDTPVDNINLNIVDETLFEDIQLDPVSGNPIIEGFISIPGEIISNENKIVSDGFNVIDENISKLETNSSEAILNLSQNNINLDKPVDNVNLEEIKKENVVKEKEEEFKFTWSDEDRREFFEILSKNKIKKSDILNLVDSNQMQLFFNQLNFSKRFENLTEFVNYFEFDSESGFLKTSEFDEVILHDFLKILTDEENLFVDNLDLLVELNNFFEKKVLPVLTEKNPEHLDFFSITSDYKMELTEFNKLIVGLSKPSSVINLELESSDLSDNFDYFDQLFEDKSNLSSEIYDNFLVRLFNKKTNWDESQSAELLDSDMKEFISNEDVFSTRSDFIENLSNFEKKKLRNSVKIYNYGDFNEFDRNSRKSQGVSSPVRLIKFPISNKSNFDLSSEVIEMFRFRFNEIESATEHRLTPNSAFLIIRQKRYKRRKVILPRNLFYKDIDGNTTKRVKSSNYTFLSQNSIILENDFNATKRYKFFKKNKARDELTNLVLSKRILRTRRTLVLPAHLNITAITNSFDVIHSWFIPGLGLKMDAIPGRATHHTFYIDNVGFYYGQCAEICGRYHHHMPIRICALPFEHFLLWWQSFGLPKLLFTKNFRRYSYSYGSRKYSW